MNTDLLKLYVAAVSIAVCLAGHLPIVRSKTGRYPVKPHASVDPLSARSLLDNDFENGFEDPWYDSSPSTVHWVVEDVSSPFEVGYPAPTSSAGSKYLRAIRDEQLSAGLLILRTVTFTALPGDKVSFNFWIRSKYTGGNTLELVLSTNESDQTLLELSSYSTSVNVEWRPATTPIPISEPMDVTLIFYAYCGGNAEDAIAIDDITVQSTFIANTSTVQTTTPSSSIPTTPSSTSMTPSSTSMTPSSTSTTPSSTSTTPPYTSTTPLAELCGGNYNDPSGIISSPNYPQPYGFNEYCQYKIQVEEGKRVVLEFIYFNTEGGADYVTVYDGLTTASVVLLRASGFNDDLVTTSGSNCLVVHSSDYQNSLIGWQATYRSL